MKEENGGVVIRLRKTLGLLLTRCTPASYLVPTGVRLWVTLETQRGKLKLRLALLLACFLILSVPRGYKLEGKRMR